MTTETTFADQSVSDERLGVAGLASVLHEIGSIEFRVIRTGLPARRMRLNTTRCTLGSGEGCTVRLNDSSLRPMHAVILRDSKRVLLRAYTVPIEVNGHLVGETFLHVGDQFTLGSYHFELTESPDSLPPRLVEKQPPYASPRVPRPSNKPESYDADTHENLSSCSELPLRVAPTPMSFTDSAAPEVPDEKQSQPSPVRGRMSFVGGGTYVSEALQAFSTSSLDANRLDDVRARSSLRAEADKLRQEVEAWRTREQSWQEKDRETQAELDDAVAHFHQSQDQAVEAGKAVAEMRTRMSQLTHELAELANDSTEYRLQASQRQERLREAADAASQARLDSLKQRDEAKREYEEVSRERDLLRRERDQILVRHNFTVCERDEAISHKEVALADRNRLTRVNEELGQHLKRSGETHSEMSEKLRQLSTELDLSAEQLRAARTELAAACARVEALSLEASLARKQLVNREQLESEHSQAQESHIEILRSEVKKLEADCAVARLQASSAATDRQLVDSLQSRLNLAESAQSADRLSWEQEATALQENIQQLAVELASVTGRMSQAEAEQEATRSELNEAYARLTTVRHELTVRPTLEQWDELQSQLADTEAQLTETEQQLGRIRRDYDELLGRQKVTEAALLMNSEPTATAAGHVESTIRMEGSWPSNANEVADRLQSYTMHDESHRSSQPSGMPAIDFVASHSNEATLSDLGDRALAPLPATEPAVSNESLELGSLAKRLIAQLNEAKSVETLDEDGSTSVSQSHGAWITSSAVWDRVSDDAATTGFAADTSNSLPADDYENDDYENKELNVGGTYERHAPWQPVDAPSIWNLHSPLDSEGTEDESNDDHYSENAIGLDVEMDDEEPIDQTFMLSDTGRVFDFHADVEAPLDPPERHESVSVHEETTSPEPAADPDDDSIEAYMNRLLKRVQGQSGSSGEVVSPKPVVKNSVERLAPKTNASEIVPELVSSPVSPVKPIATVDPNTPLFPRSQSPENASNLAAMREIAKATADNAISQSVRGQAQQLKSRAVMDLLQAGVVLVCAVAFYTCGLKITSLRCVWFTAAGLAAALAFFFIIDMLKKLSMAKATYDRANSQASSNFTEES